MPRYQYRMLRVTIWDKHGENNTKKRGGDSADRLLLVHDSERPDRVQSSDEKGDDWSSFFSRSRAEFLLYLNALGEEGWQVVTYHNTIQYWTHNHFPLGDFLLMRSQ